MAAENRNPETGLSLWRIRRMKDGIGVMPLPGFRLVLCGMDGSRALRQAGAFFRY